MNIENKNKQAMKKTIDELLKNNNYGDALEIAEREKFIDKEIQIYEKMFENCGTVSSYSGNRMEFYGLFKKAIEYYQAREELQGIQRIKKVISLTPEQAKENAEIFHESYSHPDLNKNLFWKTIYNVNQGDQETIQSLKSGLKWKNCLNSIIGQAGKN